MHISGKKGILISDEKRNMLAAANKKKQRKQIKTTLQYKKNHTSHAEKCCFLLTLGKQKGIIKSENKTLYSGGENGIHR